MTIEEIPEVLPPNWDLPIPTKLNIGITPLDEFGLPNNRRGIVTALPTKPECFEGFADAVAASVRTTIMHILEGKP